MSKDSQTRDYPVGYGKPPVATRFKPGQSGNPKGAKRKVRPSNLGEAIEIALLKRETVIINGKRRRMSRAEIIGESMVVNAAKGETNARRELLKMEQLRAKLQCQTARKNGESQAVDVYLKIGDEATTRRIIEREEEQAAERARADRQN